MWLNLRHAEQGQCGADVRTEPFQNVTQQGAELLLSPLCLNCKAKKTLLTDSFCSATGRGEQNLPLTISLTFWWATGARDDQQERGRERERETVTERERDISCTFAT